MKTNKTYTSWERTIIIFIIVLTCFSCSKSNSKMKSIQENPSNEKPDSISSCYDDEEEIIHTDLCYFNFDKVPNLILFFDSIATIYGIPYNDVDNNHYLQIKLKKSIKQIEEYRKGRIKYFPAEDIRKCLNILGHDAANIYNHACYINLGYSEWFLMCSAFYTPDISYLIDMQSPNHHIGVLNLGQSYNGNPWWSYVLCKKQKGFEVKCLKDYSEINSIFELKDKQHTYYLLSNNRNALEFEQYLYFEKEMYNIIEVATCTDQPYDPQIEFETYYFNKSKLAWYYCKWDNNMKQKIAVTPNAAMTIKLRGEKSSFIINK